ncbi:EI24 domain-containing protein [Pokkaliibacter plantistimulans]|nr:EI24 domain-containing protein [Pokkaliibacter plantistimulans]
MSWDAPSVKSGMVELIVSDLLSATILKKAMLPFVVGFVVALCALMWAGLFVFSWGSGMLTGGESSVDGLIQHVQQWLDGVPLIGVALALVAKAILGMLFSFLGVFMLGEGMILVAMLITAFLTPGIVKHIHNKHYADVPLQQHGGLVESIVKVLLKTCALAAVMVFSLPILWIPLINIVWFKVIFYAYFRSLLAQDVGENTLDEVTFKQVNRWSNMPLFWLSAVAYCLSFLPFINLFVPIIGVVALTHLFLQHGQRHRWQGDMFENLRDGRSGPPAAR